jgi:lipoprotein-anchoring transpeptidase ErfK/SrfK
LSQPKHAARRRWLRLRRLGRPPVWLIVVLTSMAVVIAATAAASYAYDRATTDRILPGVEIAGVDVSGMTRDQALRALEPAVKAGLARTVVVRAGDRHWQLTMSDLGMRMRPRKAVSRAFRLSASLSWMSRVYHRLTHRSVNASIDIPVAYPRAEIRHFVADVAAPAVAQTGSSAAFDIDGNQLVMQHARRGAEMPITAAGHALVAAMQSGRSLVRLPVRTVDPDVTDATIGKTLTVDESTNTLRLWDGFHVVRTYPVATARFGFTTPIGVWQVVGKGENPTWVNPCFGQPGCWATGEPATIPPGPGNPLGTRALYLNAPGIVIHGTPEDSSIGTYASHGCVRMHITDSEALYPLVPVGTKVVIYGAPPWGNITFNSTTGT